MKNKQTPSPRNEGVTIMMSFEEKSEFIRFCEERGVALSEMGRIGLKELMQNFDFWSEIKTKHEEIKKDSAEWREIADKWFKRHSVASHNITALKSLLNRFKINIPPGLLKKFNSGNGVQPPRRA